MHPQAHEPSVICRQRLTSIDASLNQDQPIDSNSKQFEPIKASQASLLSLPEDRLEDHIDNL